MAPPWRLAIPRCFLLLAMVTSNALISSTVAASPVHSVSSYPEDSGEGILPVTHHIVEKRGHKFGKAVVGWTDLDEEEEEDEEDEEDGNFPPEGSIDEADEEEDDKKHPLGGSVDDDEEEDEEENEEKEEEEEGEEEEDDDDKPLPPVGSVVDDDEDEYDDDRPFQPEGFVDGDDNDENEEQEDDDNTIPFTDDKIPISEPEETVDEDDLGSVNLAEDEGYDDEGYNDGNADDDGDDDDDLLLRRRHSTASNSITARSTSVLIKLWPREHFKGHTIINQVYHSSVCEDLGDNVYSASSYEIRQGCCVFFDKNGCKEGNRLFEACTGKRATLGGNNNDRITSFKCDGI